MRNLKQPLLIMASVLIIACEKEDFTFESTSPTSRTTTLTLTAQPPTEEEEITLSLTTFTTEAFPQGPTDSDTLIHVTTIPTPCSLWQGHVVALVDPIEATVPEASASASFDEAYILLLSRAEWANLPSALNTSAHTTALAIPPTYTEGTLTNWRIPTAAEAKALKATYTATAPTEASVSTSQTTNDSPSDLTTLNTLLTSISAPPLQSKDDKGTPIRYLCEDATRTFSFAPGTTISTAGTKATTYRLRLVRTLRVRLIR